MEPSGGKAMHPAIIAILAVIIVTVWFGYATFRLKYRNQGGRRRYRSFEPKWSSGRKHRKSYRFRRRVL
jgi:hypothetical protein